MTYIYPENLKAFPTLWLWRLRDMAVGGLLAVLGVVLLVQFGSPLFAAASALYLFLTIRFEDACILDFIRKASVYFIGKPQRYRWGHPVSLEVKVQNAKESKKHTKSHECAGNHRAQHRHSAGRRNCAVPRSAHKYLRAFPGKHSE